MKLGVSRDKTGVGGDLAIDGINENQVGTNMVNSSYAYDAADNWLTETVAGGSTQSDYSALDEIVSTTSASLTNITYQGALGADALSAVDRVSLEQALALLAKAEGRSLNKEQTTSYDLSGAKSIH